MILFFMKLNSLVCILQKIWWGYFLVDEEGSIYDYDTGDLIQEDVVVLNKMNYENIHDKLTKK